MLSKREELAEMDEEILCADGFDDCIIGYVEQFGRPAIALYDKELMIAKLINEEEMDEESALDHLYYNILGSYVGEYTPAFCTLFSKEK